MTAHAMKGDRERCLEAGMDGYVSKPIQPAELFRAIEEVLGQTTVPASGTPAEHEAGPVFNHAAALERAGGDESFLAELVGLFLKDCPRLLGEIRAALERQDAVGLKRAAHTLKGSAGNFEARAVCEAARALEEVGKSGGLNTAPAIFARLEHEAQRLAEALDDLVAPTACA